MCRGQRDAQDTGFQRICDGRPRAARRSIAICKSIIEAHGGTLTATPGVPTGTVFGFTPPVAEQPALPQGIFNQDSLPKD